MAKSLFIYLFIYTIDCLKHVQIKAANFSLAFGQLARRSVCLLPCWMYTLNITQCIMDNQKYCNCSKYCRNPPKLVSLATYNRHAPIRESDALSPQFHQLIASLSAQQLPVPNVHTEPRKQSDEHFRKRQRPRSQSRASGDLHEGEGSGIGMSYNDQVCVFTSVCYLLHS